MVCLFIGWAIGWAGPDKVEVKVGACFRCLFSMAEACAKCTCVYMHETLHLSHVSMMVFLQTEARDGDAKEKISRRRWRRETI